ncbi:MAG: twin-arginine translocase TatA/TatE family subunit [Quinella sp. 1Q7]|nr:twin-arginine translocase TatA/TatE family subunit [Quinella sp. 1Q7]
MFGISAGEFIIILVVGLIVFGPGKLPEVGRAIGKALREFRKAQAALSATLNEPLDEPKKSSPAQAPMSAQIAKPSTAQSTVNDDAQTPPPAQIAKPSAAQSTVNDAAQVAKPSAAQSIVTADDVINLAKTNPIVKESSNEKIFNGNPNDAPADDARASLAGAGRGTNGTDK